ncbi:polyprenyl synthetase family protein [Paenibacillus abyssi]|uniref:Farnesyl diphosphate synthase n=1 Tax=Paenibacillus abyssi TaxID=1340531 RepID=A0A917CHY1_9BACL|nr:farnesyl diphosphate synthase [Paenibacillus abyssi]GGF87138.1 farnesyl-diphosphate synthase [Paenibacillus abyssi]
MKASNSIKEYIAAQAEHIEAALQCIVPSEWDVPPTLRESMNYSTMAGGKRLRPVFVLTAAEAVTGDQSAVDAATPIACAVELIHTYSLIHDDLPAMDDDDFRRGKPTNHKVYGEAIAILAGDALLTHAFYCVTMAAKQHQVSAETALSIVEDLSVLAGAPGMVGGQAADILGEQGVTTLADLEYIHRHKTSDLIAFSLKAGGRIGGANSAQLNALEQYGRKLGLAFQIQDDILDLIGDEQKLGKKINSDVEQNKVTYPYLIGLDESKAQVERLTAEAKQLLLAANLAQPERLIQIADFLMQRDH